jgi:uncharacterized repeat protein (TIGR03806 family)
MRLLHFAAAVFAFCSAALLIAAAESERPYGLTARTETNRFLLLPPRADDSIPKLLSQTGAFKNLQEAVPAEGFIPYELVAPFWSDGADKTRFIFVPQGQTISFSPTGEWRFPAGTVFLKTFLLATNDSDARSLRRLETRVLVCDQTSGVYGVTYKWRADNHDADRLEADLTEEIPITSTGGVRTQRWYYPSPQDCLTCHTPNAGLVLGVKTRQLNRNFTYPSGVTDNQLRAWNHAGLFNPRLSDADLESLPKLAATDDLSRSLEDRARSYLDANCANCHRPGGTVAYFDARYDTPPPQQMLVDGRVLIDERIDGARVIAPNDIWRSILYLRANTTEPFKMPPLARNTIDTHGMQLLRDWIESLPGPPVLPPPDISPRGGNYPAPVEVSLKAREGATIRYTLDGTVPTPSDLPYEKPIRLSGPTIVRAKAFQPGFTKSITAQEIFLTTDEH